jgi:hypothetical protein
LAAKRKKANWRHDGGKLLVVRSNLGAADAAHRGFAVSHGDDASLI